MKKTETGVNMYFERITNKYRDPIVFEHLDYKAWTTASQNGGEPLLDGVWQGNGYTIQTNNIKLVE